MPNSTLLVLDTETVPDDLMPADWPADKMAPAIHQKIVAISFLTARIEHENDSERYWIEECRSGGEPASDERQLLAGFWSLFKRLAPRLVTFNGKGFDMQVLKHRSLLYGLSAAPFFRSGDKWNSYTQRYAPDWHLDLMEQLTDYRASVAIGLDTLCAAIGFPGKMLAHGSEVETMVAESRIGDVRAYCETDVVNLFLGYLRWQVLVGRTSAADHDDSLHSLVKLLTTLAETAPHWRLFLDKWKASKRPAFATITVAS